MGRRKKTEPTTATPDAPDVPAGPRMVTVTVTRPYVGSPPHGETLTVAHTERLQLLIDRGFLTLTREDR